MLTVIEQRIPDLSRAEQRVARWVLEHPKQAANSKLAAVAAASGTSEPSVIRFCRHIGLSGFREFTIRLTEALSRPAMFVHRNVSRDDTTDDAVAKVLDASIRALVEARAAASSLPFESAVAAMTGARQLIFVGLGGSGHVATDASHKFFRLGIPCSAITDTPTALQIASIAAPGDVFLFISGAGTWQELVRAAQIAKQRQAAVIAITESGSNLAQVASLLFGYDRREDTNVFTPMSSRLAHLTMLDALQVSLALALREPAVDNLRRCKEVLRNWPDRDFGIAIPVA